MVWVAENPPEVGELFFGGSASTVDVDYVARLNGTDQFWQLSETIVIPENKDFKVTFLALGVNDGFEGVLDGSSSFMRFLSTSQTMNVQLQIGPSYVSAVPFSEINLRDGNRNKISISRVGGDIYSQINDGAITYESGGRTAAFNITRFGRYSSSHFGGQLCDLDVEIDNVLTHSIPLTNKTQGATQLATVGTVSATMVNYTPDVWEQLL